MSFHPLAEPLLDSPPHPRCRTSVIVPVRNEELTLPRTLSALRGQRDLASNRLDPGSYEVILLLNNCSDDSERVARQVQAQHPGLALHILSRTLPPQDAHLGTVRRLLMDTAHHRLHPIPGSAILSTDADTAVAPDWIARNQAALLRGPQGAPSAEVVGGVIHLFPEDQLALARDHPPIWLAYRRDCELAGLIARLESILDPDPADPWPRHLEHFGASLACTPQVYARAGGLPVRGPLEDVAFVDALRKVGARIRHCPRTHVFTSARLDGRAEVGLSGQLRQWQRDARENLPHLVDSADWLEHRFRSMAALRRLNENPRPPRLTLYPAAWRGRLAALHAERLPTPRFLDLLDSDALIEQTFLARRRPRHAEITRVLAALTHRLARLTPEAATVPDAGLTSHL